MLNRSTEGALPTEPAQLVYEADLLGNIQQALAGLQGFGVMALELIQNADDAGAHTLSFDVTDESLFVKNNALFSTCGLAQSRCPWERDGDPEGMRRSCNFHAIARVGSRNKVYATSQIGRFGVGFVSVYQVTDAPIIRSTGVEMQLLPLDGAGTTRAITAAPGTEFELRWASMSSDTRKALNASPTPADVVSLVVHAIGDVLARGLFFLHNLTKVELFKNGIPVRSVSIARDANVVTLDLQPEQKVTRWKLLTRDASDLASERHIFDDFPTLSELDRSPVVNVALPLQSEPIDGLLYAYLPTEQSSGMPLHINADFFPHPTRRMITLSGEQHERYWNELLLDTAARAIGEHFEEIRDQLGAQRLWTLVAAAFGLKDKASFKSFWLELQVAAKASPSVLTVDDGWCLPRECHLPEQLGAEPQAALASIGLRLLHADLRTHWSVMQVLGATPLRLPIVITALEAAQAIAPFGPETPHLRWLWTAVDVIISQSKTRPDLRQLMERLKAIAFILDLDDKPASIAALWQPEGAISPALIRSFVPECPLVHRDILKLPSIAEAVDVYRFDDLAGDLAAAITDDDAARAVIGAEADDTRRFYDLLTAFKVDPSSTKAGSLLANVPMLRTQSGFVGPSRGRLPGGFTDPIGHFELIDTEPMTDRMLWLARDVLDVDVLTFRDYLAEHLEDILKSGPTREQYVALLTEILGHRAELDADDDLQPLAELAFVRTRAGTYARPVDCYYWNPALEVLLGNEGSHWVDEKWMPTGRAATRFQDLLESRLGMRTTISIEHIVSRIEAIASTMTITEIANQTQPIVRHILDRFARLRPDERRTLEKLKGLAWLPGAINGERVQKTRYPPSLLFRSFRAAGYASQVAIVDLPILRSTQSGRSLTDFLDLIGLPEEPPTEAVVAHLEYCMVEDLPASDVIYAMLNERLDKPDSGCIDRLAGKAFIYNGELKHYLRADQVFWLPTQFRGHWHSASTRMRERELLHRRLGVQDAPTARNYLDLMSALAAQAVVSDQDSEVHERCLAWLAEAVERDEAEAHAAIQEIGNAPILLNVRGEAIWPDEAVWLDSKMLADPFLGALDERLVAPPVVSRFAAARLFRALQVERLSAIAQLGLAETPTSSEAVKATERLRQRADLLLWLAPNAGFRDKLRDILAHVEVRVTDALRVHVEIAEYDPPVRSPSSAAPSFYDAKARILYVQGVPGAEIDWSAAFSALFVPLEQSSYGIDIPPVIMTAAYVASIGSWDDAERSLRNSNYRPPEGPYDDLPLTEALADAAEVTLNEEPEVEEVPVEASALRENDEGPDADSPPKGEAEEDPAKEETEDSADGEPAGSDTTGTGAGRRPSTDSPFKSKADDGAFGADSKDPGAAGGGHSDGQVDFSGGQAGNSGARGTGSNRRSAPTRAEWQERRTRMLSYVNAKPRDAAERSSGKDISGLVDLAAISAVMRYESRFGRTAVEQSHSNPGYDIMSTATDGTTRRLIEVKGLEGEWTERGVKLSHVQYATAQQHPGEYWVYVVEFARDLHKHRVSAIANPFSKVVEYWFDHGWKDAAEEIASPIDLNLEVGARVKHSTWGIGTVERINRRGIMISVLINFTHEGRRFIPFNSGLQFVD